MKSFISKFSLQKISFSRRASLLVSLLISFPTVYFLVSCNTIASRTKKHCKYINAYEKGLMDASNGKTKEGFYKEVKRCAEYGIPLNKDQYTKGRKEGLKAFCVHNKGYEFGLKGKIYLNICPKENEEVFLAGYREGDKKCLYESGYSHAVSGSQPVFASSTCLKLSAIQGQKEYAKGHFAGLKVFCTYDQGYEFGLKGKTYLNTCPKKRSNVFLKGYRAGDKKCLYESGYLHAFKGSKAAFASSVCLKLSATHSRKEYMKGRSAGLKAFCTYKEGYNLGLSNGYYQNICPKHLEGSFFKGYSLGLQEYKADQRQKELLAIEREKLAIERERTQQMIAIEQEKMDAERERTQYLLNIEDRRIEEQQATRKSLLNSQMQRCEYSSDCQEDGYCRYNYRLKDRVCQYD